MPLPQVQTQLLIISDFQGINIERGVLVRPENSWRRLENFDLVKPGVVRKIRGSKLLTTEPILNDNVIAFRDYQKTPSDPEFLIVISSTGGFFTSGISADPITLSLQGTLYLPATVMDEAPYVVSLPFTENGVKVQYVVATVGTKGFPQKYDGANLTRLGITDPEETFSEPFEHSLAIPQILYLDPTLSEKIYLYCSPDPKQGIPVLVGKQYRVCWFNPLTGHKSNLFPLHLGNYPTDDVFLNPGGDKTLTKKLGTLVATAAAQYVMAVPMFLDNGVEHTFNVLNVVQPPQPGYTHIQIYTTADGGKDFFLLPRVYDKNGALISDENGAISIASLKYGFNSLGSTVGLGADTPLYDGFAPIATLGNNSAGLFPEWYEVVQFGEVIQYQVDGPGQTGQILNVKRIGGRAIKRGYFIFDSNDDPTVYRITGVSGLGVTATWSLDKPLAVSPADNTPLLMTFLNPVSEQELITPYNDSTEIPFDKVNSPPPMSSWGGVYQNRLFLLDALDKTRLVYSKIGDYESFPINNVFRFTQADFDPITALLAGRQVGLVSEGADQRFIVAKEQSTYQITGTSILDFALTGLFPETGVIHKRAAIVVGGYTVILSRQGIEAIQGQMPVFIGSKIKELIDDVIISEFGPCFAIERKDYQLFLGLDFTITLSPFPQITQIISMREPRTGGEGGGFLSPFAQIVALPTILSTIQESGFGKDTRILAGGFDGNIYQLFTGGLLANADTPIVALAETQELPQNDRESRKEFRKIRFDGNEVNDDDGWRISFSVDRGATFTDEIQMYDENLIGMVGKTLVVRIRHIKESFENNLPQLSNMTLEYAVIGAAR